MNNSIFLIQSKDSKKQNFGTGFVVHVDEQGSYLLTCAHVVEQVVEPLVNGFSVKIIALGSSETIDLAVLYIKGVFAKPFLLQEKDCQSKNVRLMGYSLFNKTKYQEKTREATILDSVRLKNIEDHSSCNAWQIIAKDHYEIEHGNSGGPLICQESNSVMAVVSNNKGVTEGYAISVTHIKDIWVKIPQDLFLPKLKKDYLQSNINSKIKHKIFISYSHKDEKWKDELEKHLNVPMGGDSLDIWDDRKIDIGDDWFLEIKNSLEEANIAILLISVNFLNSDFIKREEIPLLLERKRDDGLHVIPLIISDCAWQRVEWLAKIQSYPRDAVPLNSLVEFKKDTAFTTFTNIICDMEVMKIKGAVKIESLFYENRPFTEKYSWQEAKEYAENLELGGYVDWRLPTRSELKAIANIDLYGEYDDLWEEWYKENKNKALKNEKNKFHFVKGSLIENMPKDSWFWTSERVDEDDVWKVGFNFGCEDMDSDLEKNYILCVRGD